METVNSLLVVVIDVNPAQKYIRLDPKAFFHCLDAVLTFANAHMMLNSGNQVCIIASHVNQSHFLYPLEVAPGQNRKIVRQQDGQHEGFLDLEKLVRYQIKGLIFDNSYVNFDMGSDKSGNTTSCLASALGRALCFINRKEKLTKPGEKFKSRIMVMTGSSESTAQYMSFMNVFFTAQKLGVVIDACVLGPYATLLSQGADITGGLYLRPPLLMGLLQYLMWMFLPEPSAREHLVLPSKVPVDYRAACFCHRQLIDQGFVCSVCLSIFCKFSPICTTCQTVFKTMPIAVPKPKKRRAPGIL